MDGPNGPPYISPDPSFPHAHAVMRVRACACTEGSGYQTRHHQTLAQLALVGVAPPDYVDSRDFHSRRGMGARTIAWGRCTPLTIVDQFGIKIRLHTFLRGARSFTEEEEEEEEGKKMMTKIRKSRMSDFSCEKTKVCMDS